MATSSQVRVLLIDDDASLGPIYAGLLRDEGILVELARSQEEAFALLASPVDFDLVLVDYSMPGMPGEEFISSLRERFPVLGRPNALAVLSCHSIRSPFAEKIRATGTMFLEKPFDMFDFVNLIQKQLSEVKSAL